MFAYSIFFSSPLLSRALHVRGFPFYRNLCARQGWSVCAPQRRGYIGVLPTRSVGGDPYFVVYVVGVYFHIVARAEQIHLTRHIREYGRLMQLEGSWIHRGIPAR